ncbi:MAG: ThuA domain-containing protein [Gemmataceae bacterium]
MLRFMLAGLFFAIAAIPADAQEKKLRVALVAGSKEYEPEKSLAILQPHLEKAGFECVRIFWKNDTDIPGLDKLETCDTMVLFARRVKLEGEQLARFKKYCTDGKPIVGIRTASHAIQTWLDLDKDILGGNYKGHYGEGEKTQVKIVEKAKDHPILKGFTPFASVGTLYKNDGITASEVLLMGSIPGHEHPIAWTNVCKSKRVFYTSLGHQQDFQQEAFLRMLTNAVQWSFNR